jgi:hypothetical protein
MQRIFLLLTVFIFAITGILFLQGCSKSNKSNNNTPSSSSEWTINGTTYKGSITGYNDTSSGLGILNSADLSGNFISVIFYSHPNATGNYVVSQAAAANDCYIQLGVFKGTALTVYTSTSKAGDMVDVTVPSGKLNAAFTNISVSAGATVTTVSGNLLQ